MTQQTLNNGDMSQEESTLLTYPQEGRWHPNLARVSYGWKALISCKLKSTRGQRSCPKRRLRMTNS